MEKIRRADKRKGYGKMQGKLIVVEGPDGSGKKTQTDKLFAHLVQEITNVRKIEFPDYESDSSALVKMYLRGEFGQNPDDVNPYAASAFFAVDRYASFKKGWQDFYLQGGIVIADRYTTSNMVHQAVKFADEDEWNRYLDWLWDLEFRAFQLPTPDLVVFLDIAPQYSRQWIADRKNKFSGDSDKDIHEKNFDYLLKSYYNACAVAKKYGWAVIKCADNGRLKTIDEIHEEIYVQVKTLLIPDIIFAGRKDTNNNLEQGG